LWFALVVPIAAHRICPACGEPTTGAFVDPEEGTLRCDLCGRSSPISPLPPLLFLTGASGSGKTTLYEDLVGNVSEALLIDADLLWGVNPNHDLPATGYRDFRGLLLHLAERLARNGQPVLIEGSCMPEQYEALGERWYFSKTAYIATVCSDDELEQRLRARPAWRGSVASLDAMLAYNRHLRELGPTTSPPIDLIDTTDRAIEDCARELHSWIRRQLQAPEPR
jgi:hypothetical protein